MKNFGQTTEISSQRGALNAVLGIIVWGIELIENLVNPLKKKLAASLEKFSKRENAFAELLLIAFIAVIVIGGLTLYFYTPVHPT